MNHDSVLVRSAVDDFWAMQVANAMQSLHGVDVLSVVFSKPENDGGVGWHVFAKFDSRQATIESIDFAISAAYNQPER